MAFNQLLMSSVFVIDFNLTYFNNKKYLFKIECPNCNNKYLLTQILDKNLNAALRKSRALLNSFKN